MSRRGAIASILATRMIVALCKHYNVPLVSMRSVLAAVKANRDGK